MDPEETEAHDSDGRASSACSACHRRKLKCDRNLDGCSTCRNSDIPCLYTPHNSMSNSTSGTRDARRKPRGPYNKGKTPREKELEHVVELLREKCNELEAQVKPHSSQHTSPSSSYEASSRISHSQSSPLNLTGISIQQYAMLNSKPASPANTIITGAGSIHPPPAKILELWLIYVTRVDTITKIIHCPSVASKVLVAKDNMNNLDSSIEAFMFSIYLAALNVLDPEEVPSRFGAAKDQLMSIYQSAINKLILAAHSSNSINFEMLQATVIHIGCLRRQLGPGTNIPTLFNTAVQMASRLGLDNFSTYGFLSPFEAEMRCRIWWTICRHEAAYAEEINDRQPVAQTTNVPLPSNYNDNDLSPDMTLLPAPRIGLTDMSFALMMFDITRLVGQMGFFIHEKAARVGSKAMAGSPSTREMSKGIVEETRTRIEQGTLRYCDTKVEVMVLESPPETDLAAVNAFHDAKVPLSLDIIECHQLILKEERLRPYQWNYKNAQQWYATIYVLEEVARRPDAAFAHRVWQVIDLEFADIELLNKHGLKPESRTKLLEAHGRALEARERLLQSRVAARTASSTPDGLPRTMPPTTNINSTAGSSQLTRPEPWQLDSSLFDVQEAQLNFDAFFWPSSQAIDSANVMQTGRSGSAKSFG